MSTVGKEKNVWGLPGRTNAYHASSDARLFSSSLPVFFHEKLNFNESNQSGLSLEDGFPSLNKLKLQDEVLDPLPVDKDELSDDFDLSWLPTQLEDLDDDIFASGGGMEIEPGNLLTGTSRMSPDSIGPSSIAQYVFANGVVSVSSEHQYGEHPSRTLFVRNINSSVEDSELKSLFEQYGDIRTLYTACKHRGFVMISYYDIRAARSAMRGLQNTPLRRRKLDIHFSIPKDNPSEKDLNQGTLVVFNVDDSVSNDDLRQIFGAYGSVKEIRETPHKRHHKFVEFYDVRGADAALQALNRCDIAGKRIKLEPSRPGGARRSSLLQPSQDQELDEARGLCRPTGAPISNSPPGIWKYFGSPVEQKSLHGYSQSPLFGGRVSPVKISPIGSRISHSNRVFTNGEHGAPYQQHFSAPDSMISLSPGTASSFSDSKPSSVGTLSGPQFLWGSPAVNSDLITSQKGLPFPSRAHGIGFPFHVGSAPSCIQMERHIGFFVESGSSSSRMMPMSTNGPMYFGGNDGAMDRGRRRADSGSQMDSKSQYQLDLEKIRNGEDTRTTLMIKNIPNKYTSKMLLLTIDETHKGAYDFLYLPIDFKNKCNVGYAFINMVSPLHIISLFEAFDGKKWEKFNSEKVAALAYARIQGNVALVSHFQNSSLMNEDKRFRPILFQSEGQESDHLVNFSSSNLNIFVRQPDGSYTGDALDSPKGDQDQKPYGFWSN
ncbi:protein MEI2-like 2 [Salvia hispanica]|uniref:protein MEI2-like 2 n=1 Tax=Salvia hispanica TaxID=49212 RepID=UPI002009417A|nr:protein MEI2-like 2 [Salvia hispanica]XP_047950501.1 protein MEI2-like 2 [Salvia hispanica]